MISCPKCGKENQDHYKFCLGCGNELPRDGGPGRVLRPTPNAVPVVNPEPAKRPIPPATPIPISAFANAPSNPLGAAAPFAQVQPQVQAQAQPQVNVYPPTSARGPAPPIASVSVSQAPGFPSTCPQCSSPNPRNNRFCITCGFDMSTAVVSQAPVSAALVPSPVQPPAPFSVPLPVQQTAPAAQALAPQRAPESQSAPLQAPVAVLAPTVPVQLQRAPEQRAPVAPVERAKLVLIRPDGTEGGTSSLMDGHNLIGRDAGGLFAQDMYLSPHHAGITLQGSQITVEDNHSLNGVYLRIERQVTVNINDGDIFRIGQEILQYKAFGPPALESDGTEKIGAQLEGLLGKVSLVVGRDSYGNAFPIPVTGLYLGRERGDILFPDDGYVSGLHCQLSVSAGQLTLTDVGSSNGTYLRVEGPRALRDGDFLLMGQQLFRLNLV